MVLLHRVGQALEDRHDLIELENIGTYE